MTAVLLAMLAAAPAPRVHLELQPSLPCHLDATLPDALLLQQVEVGDGAWSLRIERQDTAVAFRLVDAHGTVRGDRRLELAQGDCPVLARTIALLVKSWMLMTPRLADAPARAHAFSPLPAPAPLPVPEQVEPAAAPVRPEVHAVLPPVLSPASGPKLAVMLSGGGSVGVDDAPVASGSMRAELAFNRRWALGVEGGLQSTRRQASGADSVSAQLTWAGISARLAFALASSDLLCIALGARVVRLDAVGGSVHTDIFLPALGSRLELRHDLAGGLFLLAGVGVDARLFPEQIVSGHASLTLPPWGFGLELGAGWTFP